MNTNVAPRATKDKKEWAEIPNKSSNFSYKITKLDGPTVMLMLGIFKEIDLLIVFHCCIPVGCGRSCITLVDLFFFARRCKLVQWLSGKFGGHGRKERDLVLGIFQTSFNKLPLK